MTETVGVSPKIVAAFITGLVTWALLKFGISLDSKLEGLIQLGATIAAGYFAPPGDVTVPPVGVGSDAGLTPTASSRLGRERI